jgi:type II secretory pathway component PulJ
VTADSHDMPIAMRSRGMRSDAGVTLVEVLISASLFTVVLSLVGAGLAELGKSAARTTALSNAQDALRLAWQRLEGEVRYASAIGAPAQVPGDAGSARRSSTAAPCPRTSRRV